MPTSTAVLDAPMSPSAARARVKDGVLEAVVVLDVLKLIASRTDRWVDLVAEAVLEDTSQMRSIHPLRILGDAPGYPTDRRRQYMLVRVRLELFPQQI